MTRHLSPILLFTYNRLASLKQTVNALQQNFLAGESELFIFSDAAKSGKDADAVAQVREFIKTITGFKQISIVESPINKGLARSIIDGVSSVMSRYETVIVLEDDLVSSRNFLSFMNQSLAQFDTNQKLFSVAGFSMPMKGIDSDVYFTKRGSSWGWATWRDRWDKIDWLVSDYAEFTKNDPLRHAFNKMGSDLSGMLDRQMHGKINSWAIRWCYHQFKHDLYTVHPAISKIMNIGLESPDATHTNERYSRFKTQLDTVEKSDFLFPEEVSLDPKIIRQFTRPYSIPQRVKYKLLNSLLKT